MSKILPVAQPEIYCYNIIGSILSIVSLDEGYLPWFHSSFIQLQYNTQSRLLFFTDQFSLWNIPGIENQRMTRQFILTKWGNITDFIKDALAMDLYVFIWAVDRYFLPDTAFFQTTHMTHELFVYGVEKDGNFLIADNLDNGKYVHKKCPEFLLNQAFINSQGIYDYQQFVYLLSKRKGRFDFQLENVKRQIEDYCASRNTFFTPCKYNGYFKNTILGLQVLKHLARDVSNKLLDIRAFHLIWEHKKCMSRRIIFLGKQHGLANYRLYSDRYNEIENQALVMRNLVLKYKLTNDERLLHKIISQIELLHENEKAILEDVLDSLAFITQ